MATLSIKLFFRARHKLYKICVQNSHQAIFCARHRKWPHFPLSYILCAAQKVPTPSIKHFCARYRKKTDFLSSYILCAAQKMSRLSIKLYFVRSTENEQTLLQVIFCAQHRKRPDSPSSYILCVTQKMTRLSIKHTLCGHKLSRTSLKFILFQARKLSEHSIKLYFVLSTEIDQTICVEILVQLRNLKAAPYKILYRLMKV